LYRLFSFLNREVYLANVTIFNTDISFPSIPGFSHLTILSHTQEFSISQRPDLSASFGKSGLLKALRVGNTIFPVHLDFVKYGTRGSGKDKSGAYLFLPDKPEPDVVFMDSKAMPYVRHTCTLFNSPGSDGLGLHIFNEVDITETQNYELAMRFNTDIESGDQFFTDLNGLNVSMLISKQKIIF